jgi:Glycosyltransferase (GlcNAc)
MYARLFTHGYDVYTPTRTYIGHDYNGANNPNAHGWYVESVRDRKADEERANKRLWTLLEMPGGNETREGRVSLPLSAELRACAQSLARWHATSAKSREHFALSCSCGDLAHMQGRSLQTACTCCLQQHRSVHGMVRSASICSVDFFTCAASHRASMLISVGCMHCRPAHTTTCSTATSLCASIIGAMSQQRSALCRYTHHTPCTQDAVQFGPFGLGEARTLEELQEFTRIDLHKRIHIGDAAESCGTVHYVPPSGTPPQLSGYRDNMRDGPFWPQVREALLAQGEWTAADEAYMRSLLSLEPLSSGSAARAGPRLPEGAALWLLLTLLVAATVAVTRLVLAEARAMSDGRSAAAGLLPLLVGKVSGRGSKHV